MSDKTEGFFCVNHKLYYGEYIKEQVNGGIRMDCIYKNNICTEREFDKKEFAAEFFNNHAMTYPEMEALKSGLGRLSVILGNSVPDFDNTVSDSELPKEINYLQAFLLKNPFFTEGKERFLSLKELYVDDGNIVFYKSKRTPFGLSLENRTVMNYYKKDWHYYNQRENFIQFVFQYLFANAIIVMPNTVNAILRGRIKSEFDNKIKKELDKAFGDKLRIFEEYSNAGHFLLYGKDCTLVWFRTSGMYADILIGSSKEESLNSIISSVPQDWKPDWKQNIK